MACISRKVLLLGGLVIFIVLVATYFGYYAINHDDDAATTTTPSHHVTSPSPSPSPSSNPTSSTTPSSTPSPIPGPVVSITSGKLEGEWVDGAQGGGFRYAAFRGVPYAQPPLGDLRFKGPQPPEKWDGVRPAKTEGNTCFQSGNIGSEDCLVLNVYTPKLPSSQEKPQLAVYVFIHGGIFQYGSSTASELGPDFLVQQDLIVVTMNYRLGVLGYISLDTEEIPGNLGLKDAVQALRWVKQNIVHFGGDPSRVTLGGQSSGGVSASWLTVLPSTKGLFRSAIIQSGTAVQSWSYTVRNIDFAKKVYELLTGKASEDLSEIARAVKAATLLDLYNAAENATVILQRQDQGLGTDIIFFYLPSIERRPRGSEEILIQADAESYIITGQAPDIPIILGETRREWSSFFTLGNLYTDTTTLEAKIHTLMTYAPMTLVPGSDTQEVLRITDQVPNLDVKKYIEEIQDHYFFSDNDPECDAIDEKDRCKMAKYLDQAYIMADTSHLLRLRAKYSNAATYPYIFSLKSDYNHDLSALPDYLRNNVVHGDDMNYVWHGKGSGNQDYNGNGTASMALRRQVAMWANFIKDGDPTPSIDELFTERWHPVNKNDLESYLDIDENLTNKAQGMSGEDSELWTSIFSELRANLSP